LLSEFGVPVPPGRVATTGKEAKKINAELGGKGSNKGTGICRRRAKRVVLNSQNPDEADKWASALINTNLGYSPDRSQGSSNKKGISRKSTILSEKLYLV